MAENVANKIFWEKHWKNMFNQNDNAVWEVPFEESIEGDFKTFEPFFNDTKIVVDIGCGSGYYTKYLSEKYSKVIGVDASLYAIKKAKLNYPEVEFKQVNLMDKDEVLNLKSFIGDCDIYLRGVLHQIPLFERNLFCESLKTLIGDSGCLFMNESIPDQKVKIMKNDSKLFNIPLKSNPFLPSGIDRKEILNYFPIDIYRILAYKDSVLNTTLSLGNGKSLFLESQIYVVEKM